MRIVILGGGFGGVYTAMYLEEHLKKLPGWEVAIVNRENYFVYQPMLAEVVGGAVGILDTVSPLDRLLPDCQRVIREIESIDLEKKQVILSPRFTHSPQRLDYDHLVLALGNVANFQGAKGLHEHAFAFKNLADSLNIRNHLIDVMDTAAITQDPGLRKQLLTFVVGGGGFSGTEIVAELNDFVRGIAKKNRSIKPEEIRVVLVHKRNRLMERELNESLSHYTENILKKRGVEIHFEDTLNIATPEEAILGSGERIPSKTIISTVPVSANPILHALKLPMENERIKTDPTFLVEGTDHIWALGDCARVPLPDGHICPPTAQCAIRQAKLLAQNISLTLQNQPRKPFFFKSLGMFGALGHHSAVGEVLGDLKFSGFFAWLLWRAIYWIKLPGIDRKVKVAFSWMLDAIFPIQTVQLKLSPTQGIVKLHYEPGEIIFHEGDVGDYFYIIAEGAVDVIQDEKLVRQLKKGDFFGEGALLNEKMRSATIRCNAPCDVLALRKSDFGALITNFKQLRELFDQKQ